MKSPAYPLKTRKVDKHGLFVVAQFSNGDLNVTLENQQSILITPKLEVFDLYPREDGKIEAKLRNSGHTSNENSPPLTDQVQKTQS